MEAKKEIRHKIIRLRKEMDPLVWQQATNDITERVINHPRFLEETDIYCYANYNGEVGTSSIMEEAWKLGKSVWFPRIEGSEMNFYLVESKDDLQPGAYGILEPTGDHIADGEDGLLIMPGVAFDEECHRIGYGGGFYDKYLEKHPDTVIICDEVGNGIVPLDSFEREYRERLGRLLCEIAAKAERVERIVCGIGQRIK